MILRPGTVDRDVFVANHEQNEYDLPERIDDWVVIDGGAHIGSFSYTCLTRGAQHVFSFEPENHNYTICKQNLAEFALRSTVSRLALWGNGLIGPRQLKISEWGMLGTTLNTGGGSLVYGEGIQNVYRVALDDIINLARVNCQVREIDLLKLDVEGSEWPILFGSDKLNQIKRIVGEFHEGTLPFKVKGQSTFTMEDLIERLTQLGFQVESRRHGSPEEGLGLFSAERL